MQMYANRFDLCVAVLSTVLWLIFCAPNPTAPTVVLTLPLLRFFTVVPRLRVYVFTFITLLPQFWSLMMLLLVVFFTFAEFGVSLFSGSWTILPKVSLVVIVACAATHRHACTI